MAELVVEAQQTAAAQPQEAVSQRSTAEQLQEATPWRGTAERPHKDAAWGGMAEQPGVQHLPPRPLEPTPSGDLRLPERNEAQRVTADAGERDGVRCLLLTGCVNDTSTRPLQGCQQLWPQLTVAAGSARHISLPSCTVHHCGSVVSTLSFFLVKAAAEQADCRVSRQGSMSHADAEARQEQCHESQHHCSRVPARAEAKQNSVPSASSLLHSTPYPRFKRKAAIQAQTSHACRCRHQSGGLC